VIRKNKSVYLMLPRVFFLSFSVLLSQKNIHSVLKNSVIVIGMIVWVFSQDVWAIDKEELKSRWAYRESLFKQYICVYEEWYDINDSTPKQFQAASFKERKKVVFWAQDNLFRVETSVIGTDFQSMKAYDGKKTYDFMPASRNKDRKVPNEFTVSSTEQPEVLVGRVPRCFINRINSIYDVTQVLAGAKDMDIQDANGVVVVKMNPSGKTDMLVTFDINKGCAMVGWELQKNNKTILKAVVESWNMVDEIYVPQKTRLDQFGDDSNGAELVQRFEFKYFDFKKEFDKEIFTLKPTGDGQPLRIYDADLQAFLRLNMGKERKELGVDVQKIDLKQVGNNGNRVNATEKISSATVSASNEKAKSAPVKPSEITYDTSYSKYVLGGIIFLLVVLSGWSILRRKR
jgi:hypothetical protein